jgi:hypothetical protein
VDVPFAFTAAIVNVYAWFETKDAVTAIGLEVPEYESERDGLEVIVYEVIAEPPVALAVNGTLTTVSLVLVTVPIVGA